jgi:hypothetical protein
VITCGGFVCISAAASAGANKNSQPVEPPKPIATESTTTPAEPIPAATPAPATPTAEDLKYFAINDLAKVDADYHDQGEYVGEITVNGSTCTIGVQVVALGDGKFDALVFQGGLPGNGYNGAVRQKLSGERIGTQVTLKGDCLNVVLQTGFAALVKSPSGDRLGTLQPVKRVSQTMGAKPPADAIVLFDGVNTDRLAEAKVTADGLLEVGCETKDVYQNFTLHAEFRVPYMPYARGQSRGNSGFYLQRRYEVQVLDSFGLELQFNDCASLYRFKAPDLNMSFPPLRWQTYDLTFTGAKFDVCGNKVCKARITVRHNGVVVHNQVDLENKTGGGKPEGPDPLVILLQNHKNPVNFRNIWLIDHGGSSRAGDFMASSTANGCATGNCCSAPCQVECQPRRLLRRFSH